MLLVWTTDLHLNSVSTLAWKKWIHKTASQGADGIVITGDISEGDDVVRQLHRIADATGIPIYFVLGNHDFYESSLQATRHDVIHACREHEQLHYLTDLSPIQLTPTTHLLGDDGWADATVGDYETSTIRLNDFDRIDDFKASGKTAWKEQLQQIGAASAKRLQAKLNQLPPDAQQVLVLTHVPPFREACWYEGKTANDNWAPFFVSGQVGKELMLFSQQKPEYELTVLCGHTHHAGIARLTPNLIVHTGAAAYGHPDVEGIISMRSGNLQVNVIGNQISG
ncbi:MAG: metallophosphoesterase [Rubripirellula sp.]|nr:metallophosphoesterase [Rubripirellula sp.]